MKVPTRKTGALGRISLGYFGTDCPPTASDWKEGTNDIDSYFKVVGLDKSWPGDIISDGIHCGIIEKWGTTISAAEDKVVENDYGFRKQGFGNINSVIIRRYHS